MKYLMLIAVPEVDDEVPAGCGTWKEDHEKAGVLHGAEQLRNSSEATSVRVRDGQVHLSDGPYTEAKEVIAGYALIECETLADAVDIAAKHPGAVDGVVEIRPLLNQN